MARRDADGALVPGTWRIGSVVVAAVLALAAAIMCGALGWWQWERAQSQGRVIVPGPAVPIAEVTRPGEATTGIGRVVVATGEWDDAPVAYVVDRQVEGIEAVLLVLPLRVDAEATGVGEPATLAVLAGWLPAGDVPPSVSVAGSTTVTGVLRSSEAVSQIEIPQAPGEPLRLESVSTAALATVWPSPVYTPVVTADDPAPGWNPLPPPPVERSLDIRSVTYAAEWWLFGAFAVFLAARWIRDNGRVGPRETERSDAATTTIDRTGEHG
jgi:cytochrome oxidase assembly protein ShyY1